MRRTKQAFLKK